MGPAGGRDLIVYTGGTFDTFHRGHENFLRQCRLLAGPTGTVIVSLNTDEFIEEFKHHPPVEAYEVRRQKVLGCHYVSAVIPNLGGADSKPAIESVDPDVIAIDTGWMHLDYYSQMGFTQQWLDDKGIVLCYLPRTPGISSSQLAGRMPEPSTPDPGSRW